MKRNTIKFHMEKIGTLPTYTTCAEQGEEYENVMYNRRNTTSREDMENMVNHWFNRLSRDNTEELNGEAKTFNVRRL